MKTKLKVAWSESFAEYYLDEELPEQGARELADWLDTDVPSLERADQLIGMITATSKSGPKSGDIDRGDAHEVLGLGDSLLIACLYVPEQKVLLTREQAVSALQHYKDFLRARTEVPGRPPEPFEVEYEAEGEEALRRYLALRGAEAFTREDVAGASSPGPDDPQDRQ